MTWTCRRCKAADQQGCICTACGAPRGMRFSVPEIINICVALIGMVMVTTYLYSRQAYGAEHIPLPRPDPRGPHVQQSTVIEVEFVDDHVDTTGKADAWLLMEGFYNNGQTRGETGVPK